MSKTRPSEQVDARLLSSLESILLVAGGPVQLSALARALQQPRSVIVDLLHQLRRSLTGGIRLQLSESEAQLVTAHENVEVVQRFLGAATPPPLSRPALETLTIIAYRQNVTRPEIEALRGVNSDRAVQTLLARGLIEERGQRQAPGRAMQYGTTFGFLEYFGLASLDQLPPLETEDEPQLSSSQMGFRE